MGALDSQGIFVYDGTEDAAPADDLLNLLGGSVSAAIAARVPAPTATATAGTGSAGTTETRDAILGNYVFTARAGRRYRVAVDGMSLNTDAVGDHYSVRVRNGGPSTPTTASPIVAALEVTLPAVGTAGRLPCPVAGSFVPGAGTVTLSVFVQRITGTGAGTPVSAGTHPRQLYVIDLGPDL